MDVQASVPTYNIRYNAEEDRPLISIGVLPDGEFAMSLTCRRPGRAEGRTLSRAATWAAGAAALMTLATLLAGCHTTRVVWAKPGGDDAALQDDMRTCNYRPTTTVPDYQAAAVPGYQPPQAPTPFSTGPMTSAYSTPTYPTSAYSRDTKSATIDVQDAERSPVSCMIAHGWRLTPLP